MATQPSLEEKYAEVLAIGNLTAQAEDTSHSLAIGIMTMVWTVWVIVSMLVPWQNSYHTGTYDPPITYIFTGIQQNSAWESFLTLGYFFSWVFNILVFFVEWIAWIAGGDFFAFWVYIGLWGGLVLGAVPWVCEVVYIFHEWPQRQSGSAWQYIFWSAEFWMLFMQGLFWLISFIIHIICVGPVIRMVDARKALDAGVTNRASCACDPCSYPVGEVERAQAERICKAACDKKCPKDEAEACPLKRFEDETEKDYGRRCNAAATLAKAAAEREAEDDFDQENAGDGFADTADNLADDATSGGDIASPDDEW